MLAAASSLAAQKPALPASYPEPPISLRETLTPSPLVRLQERRVTIRGRVREPVPPNVMVRVTTGLGVSWQILLAVTNGHLQCRYPDGFPGAPALVAGALSIDATTDADFRVARPGHAQAEGMLAYVCGDNPWQARLFNELGGVYNWTDDTDGDGLEDLLRQDMYPESTAFCQIGMLRLIQALR